MGKKQHTPIRGKAAEVMTVSRKVNAGLTENEVNEQRPGGGEGASPTDVRGSSRGGRRRGPKAGRVSWFNPKKETAKAKRPEGQKEDTRSKFIPGTHRAMKGGT